MDMIGRGKRILNNDAAIANTVGFGLYRMCRPDRAHLLKGNMKFKKLYEGERCFILGNGPSLKEQNIELLKHEYVFTVNQFCRNPISEVIKPNFHFWVDDLFFTVDRNKNEDMELVSVMKKFRKSILKQSVFFPFRKNILLRNFN